VPYGKNRQYVYQLWQIYKIPSSIADNSDRNIKIVALYKKGTSGTAIAEKFGLSFSWACRIINDAIQEKTNP
jgi:acyl-CoA-binding protein